MSTKTPKKDFLDTLYRLFTSPFFFGILDTEKSHALLIHSKHSLKSQSNWLLRWSESDLKFLLDYKKKGRGVTSIPIKTESISELLKKDLKKVLSENRLKEERYLKQGRDPRLQVLTIKEEHKPTYSGLPYMNTSKEVLDPNLIDLLRISDVSHFNFILD